MGAFDTLGRAGAAAGQRSAGAFLRRLMLRGSEGREVWINPTADDIARMTRQRLGRPAYETDSVRYIVDEAGNIYAAPAYTTTHDDLARELSRQGYSLKGWQEHADAGDRYSHGLNSGFWTRRGDNWRAWPPQT